MDDLGNLGDVDIDAANALAAALTKGLDPAGINVELQSRILETIIRTGNQAKVRLVSDTAPTIALDAEEQELFDHINAAFNGILGLGLKVNQQELAAAAHVMQGFVIRHMLGRLEGGEKPVFSRWFKR